MGEDFRLITPGLLRHLSALTLIGTKQGNILPTNYLPMADSQQPGFIEAKKNTEKRSPITQGKRIL
jgi:hypothetical protein